MCELNCGQVHNSVFYPQPLGPVDSANREKWEHNTSITSSKAASCCPIAAPNRARPRSTSCAALSRRRGYTRRRSRGGYERRLWAMEDGLGEGDGADDEPPRKWWQLWK